MSTEKLQIEKQNAIKAYEGADDKGKKLLVDLFGRLTFIGSFKDIVLAATDAQQLYEDACAYIGEPVRTLQEFSFLGYTAQYQYSLHRITTVIEAAKEGKELDYDNTNQGKYYPWADMRTPKGQSAGSGFAFDVCGYGNANAHVGSRLCSFSREIAEKIFHLMEDDYRHFMKPLSK